MVMFKRVKPRLFVEAVHERDVANARVAFIPDTEPGSDEIDPVAEIDRGCVILFPRLDDPDVFLRLAVNQLDQQNPQPKRARIAIFSRKSQIRSSDIVRSSAAGSGLTDGFVQLGTLASGSGSTLEPPTGNGRWRIHLSKAKLEGAGDILKIVFATNANKPGLQLTPNIAVPFPAGERVIELPLTGADRALWRFAAVLDRALIVELGIGPRYFKAREEFGVIDVAHHSFPFFDFAAAQTERFLFEVDCADPYDADPKLARSRLRPPSTLLPTHLHSVQGHRLFVKAVPLNGKPSPLAFMKAPRFFNSGSGTPVLSELEHHVVPTGSFELHSDDVQSRSVRLALGASNLESVEVRLGSGGDLLGFAPGPALVVDGATPFAGMLPADDEVPLADIGALCRTSWLQAGPATNLNGVSRLSLDPEGMQPYSQDGDLMRFSPSHPDVKNGFLPWVPVLGVAASASKGRSELALERDFLSRSRRKLLIPSTVKIFGVDGPPPVVETGLRTPQGYEAKRTDKGWLAEITFGRTKPREADSNRSQERPDFGLRPTTATGTALLAEIMAANRLFVATKLGKLTGHFDPQSLNRIYMADWRVGWVKPDGTHTTDPFVILKHDNRSVANLVKDEAQWTNRQGVLALDSTERGELRAIVAATLANQDPLYAPLKRRLEDPRWSGLVMFDLELTEMPAQLGALETLVDENQNLKVHHVGIDLSAIEQQAGPAWKTSVFGLVDYKAVSTAPFKPDTLESLALRIEELRLLVDNDAVKSFTCQVLTNIKTFLETDVKKPAKDLVLLGRYQSRVTETGERRDSYSFEAQGSFVVTFDDDHFLKQIEISRVALITEIKGKEKHGKLLIDGDLSFNQIGGGLDILGIDRVEFFDLGVSFGPRGSLFKLNIDFPNLRLDLEGFNRRGGKNKTRAGSFLSKLPLKLRGFRFGSFDLPKIGYFDFSAIKGVELVPDFKMALDFDLDLGSLGALAKKLERFKLNLLIGWTPASLSSKLRLAFGFRIDAGEGAGGIDFGIEGIMRLTAEYFRLAMAKTGDGRELVVIGASNARLKLFSVEVPSPNEKFSFWLFAPMAPGSSLAEKLGWYARIKDDKPEDPVAITDLALGQRVLLDLPEVKTVRDTISWLDKQQEFASDEDFIRFAGSAGSTLSYAPNREWFVAMSGSFFELVDIKLLLRDPDLYGIYFALLGQTDLSVDLLYQKLADGVGRYAAEIMLPAELRNLDFGAVAVTLGAIRVEVYTDGGFLIDLGFPKHVDYSRSFVVQGGPFIGKGGFYIGRVPREALPKIPNYSTGKAFRVGFALRIGLGREVERGPLRASLSVSVYGRVEGAIARIPPARLLARRRKAGPAVRDSEYYVWVQGELGILLEIEGRVDLKLVQARVLVRAWIGAGVTFETGEPIVLHGVAGIQVSVEVVIGRIKIFGKTIKITVRVGYSTELRYEWVLPARTPSTLLPAVKPFSGWADRGLSELRVSATAFELKLLLDVSRSTDGQPRAVLIPSAFLFNGGGASPLKPLGEALINWAVIELGKDPATIWLRRAEDPDFTDDLDVDLLRAKIADFDSMATVTLENLLKQLFPNASIDIAFGDAPGSGTVDDPQAQTVDGLAFPIPPGLNLRIGNDLYDFSKLGEATDAEVAAIVDELSRQFAQQSPQRQAPLTSTTKRPMVDHLFRHWCELFALTVLDTLQNAWAPDQNRKKLAELLNGWDWEMAARRTGRTYHAGLRIATPTGSVSLLERAGLLLPLPAGDADIVIEGLSGSSWLTAEKSVLKLLKANAAKVGEADPRIDCTVERPAAVDIRQRSFLHPPFARLLADGAEVGLLNPMSEDFLGQLHRVTRSTVPPLEQKARRTNTASGLKVEEEALIKEPVRALAFDMSVELVQRAHGSTAAEPVEDCLHIAGSSEAERRPLDALLSGEPALVEARLKGAKAYLALQVAGADDQLTVIDSALAGVMLARATISVERRPGQSRLRAGAAGDEDSIFLVTGADLPNFLRLMQRAAIVNSGGTYLLLPKGSTFFDRIKADRGAKLTMIVRFDPAAPLPVRTLNAVVIADEEDRKTLKSLDDSKPRRLATRPKWTSGDDISDRNSLFETVSLREPGSALLRVLRKKPKEIQPSDPPTKEECEAHLAMLFDMLEFGVTRGGKRLLAADRSVPLASQELLPATATAAQQADLVGERPDFLVSDQLRYDLLVPAWRLLEPAVDNPYLAVGGDPFKVSLGWRDLYGNRLAKPVHEEQVEIVYQDPVIPVHAWPGVRAFATIGSRTDTLAADFSFFLPTFADPDQKAIWLRSLQAVIHQLAGPGVKIGLRSRLGAVGQVADFPAKLVDRLIQLGKATTAPAAIRFDVPITRIDTAKAHSEIEVELFVERETALCDPDAPSDVRGVVSALKLRHQGATGDSAEDSREAFKIATQFRKAFPKYWAALGTTDTGGNSWWAVDQRLIPAARGAEPIMYSQPPLARAPMSVAAVAYPDLQPDGSVLARTFDGLDLDSDLLMADFTARVDTFLAPPLAALVSQVPAAMGKSPFERVMRAKKAMLSAQGDNQLLRFVKPVYAGKADTHPAAARRAMREACAGQMSRFGEVASVVVQPLSFAADVPDSWFSGAAEDEMAPKLYGRLRFGAADSKGDARVNAIRALNHGIPLRDRETELAFTVLPPIDKVQGTTEPSEIDLTDQVAFQVTHVEREVGASGQFLGGEAGEPQPAAPPAPSRWLSLVPIDNAAEPLPLIDISQSKRMVAPAPLRRLPASPVVVDPVIAPARASPPPAPYAEAIKDSRNWSYGFTLGGMEQAADQACCRLVYNAGVGADRLPAVQTPADPLFENLLPPLTAFKAAMITLWPQIQAAAGPTPPPHFDRACAVFADLVEAVCNGLATSARARNVAKIEEDRFIVSWSSTALLLTVAFRDHLPEPGKNEEERRPIAGAGEPWVRVVYGTSDRKKKVDSHFQAEFPAPAPLLKSLGLGFEPLDAMILQSVWAAASIRRNAEIDKKKVDSKFVYRTAEVYLQEALVPNLHQPRAIPMGTRPNETLEQRLEAALVPIFKGSGRKVPVQIRIGLESIRLTDATNPPGAPAEQGFVPEPDPKVQLVQSVLEGDVAAIARRLAAKLSAMFAAEPIGRAEDVRLVMAVVVRTETDQPLLEIARILIPLDRLSQRLRRGSRSEGGRRRTGKKRGRDGQG